MNIHLGLSVRRLIRKCSLITNKQYIILKYRIFHIYTSLIRLPRVWRRGMHEGIRNWFVYPNGNGIGPTRPQNSQILYEVFQMLGPITGNLKLLIFTRSCSLFIAWLGFRGNWNIFRRIAFYRYFPVTWSFGYFFFFGISTCSVAEIKVLRETGIKSLSGPFSVIENKKSVDNNIPAKWKKREWDTKRGSRFLWPLTDNSCHNCGFIWSLFVLISSEFAT